MCRANKDLFPKEWEHIMNSIQKIQCNTLSTDTTGNAPFLVRTGKLTSPIRGNHYLCFGFTHSRHAHATGRKSPG